MFLLRWIVIISFFFFKRGYLMELYHRANYLEVGATGTVTVMERQYVENHKLQKLSKFEKWLMAGYIKREKASREAAYYQV